MAKDKKPAAKTAAGNTSAGKTIEGKAEDVQKKKKKTSPMEYVQQVRAEARKVTWTTRNETLVSTVMVLIMVALMSIFFLIVDQVLRFGVQSVLSL